MCSLYKYHLVLLNIKSKNIVAPRRQTKGFALYPQGSSGSLDPKSETENLIFSKFVARLRLEF